MAGQSIPVNTADQMVEKYLDYMTGLGVNMETQTQTVSFSLPELKNWLDSVEPNADEIRVFMAAYPQGENEPKTTVIFWAYRGGEPAVNGDNEEIEPYNDGQTDP